MEFLEDIKLDAIALLTVALLVCLVVLHNRQGALDDCQDKLVAAQAQPAIDKAAAIASDNVAATAEVQKSEAIDLAAEAEQNKQSIQLATGLASIEMGIKNAPSSTCLPPDLLAVINGVRQQQRSDSHS